MKQQVARLSPHQNAKVVAVLMTVFALVFMMPFMLLQSLLLPPEVAGFPLFLLVMFPVLYLVLGYLLTAVSCIVYNAMFKVIGGIEVEWRGDAA